MNIIWTDEATDSFEAAYEALAGRFPRSASRFGDRVFEWVQRISVFPELGQTVPEHDNPRFREVRVGHYRMLYRISADGITIEAFLHMSVRLEVKD